MGVHRNLGGEENKASEPLVGRDGKEGTHISDIRKEKEGAVSAIKEGKVAHKEIVGGMAP